MGKWPFIIRQATKVANTAMKFVHTNCVCKQGIKSKIVNNDDIKIATEVLRLLMPPLEHFVKLFNNARKFSTVARYLHADAPKNAPQTRPGHPR